VKFRAPAARPASEHVRVVEQPVEQRGHRGGVAEQLAPVVDGPIRGQDRRRAFVAPHDQFEQIFCGRGRELPHPQIIDDQQRDGAEGGEDVLARAIERGVGQLLEEQMGLAVQHAMALLDRRLAERLRQVTFPRAGGADQQNIFTLGDETTGGEFEEQRAVHLLVEGEVKRVERAGGIAEARLDATSFEQPILSPLQLVVDEHRDQVERREPLGLGVAQPRLEHVGHAGEAERAERAVEFSEVHGRCLGDQ